VLVPQRRTRRSKFSTGEQGTDVQFSRRNARSIPQKGLSLLSKEDENDDRAMDKRCDKAMTTC
jgi:hypothetical protein